MKQNLKNYNFYNFNFKHEKTCVNKNELTINSHYNLTVNNSTIKPLFGFKSYLEKILGDKFSLFIEKYPNFQNEFIYLKKYQYFSVNYEKSEIIFAISNNLELFHISMSDLEIYPLEITFNNFPEIFEKNQKLYFYSKNDKLVFFDRSSDPIFVSNFTNLNSFCDFQDKSYFVVDERPYDIYYCEKIEIENIDETIDVYDCVSVSQNDGKILSLVKFKGSLYIIQQFAISKLVGNNLTYYLNSNCNIGSMILENTISKINDYLIFYSSDGLYIFDGNELKQVFNLGEDSFSTSNIYKSFIYNNKYYILTDINLESQSKKCLVEFDVLKNKMSIFSVPDLLDAYTNISIDDYDLILLSKSNDKFTLLYFDKNQFLQGKKYVKFNQICFDDSDSKYISAIKINSVGEFDLIISTEGSKQLFHIKDNVSISNLSLKGYCFEIEISSDKYFELKSMIFSVETII